MRKPILIVFLSFLGFTAQSQEKQLWAKSFINERAPELVVEKWLSDEPDTNGKFVLIDFWATWCGPCKKAIPDLNRFQKEFKENLVVIGISDETEAKVVLQKNPQIEYYNAIDTKKRLNNSYGVQGIPHCVIIDPDGIVVWEGWPHLKDFELTSDVVSSIISDN